MGKREKGEERVKGEGEREVGEEGEREVGVNYNGMFNIPLYLKDTILCGYLI